MPFVLWLFRHGEATPAAEGGDAARTLSPRGEAAVARLAADLAAEGWRPTRVFASPLRRATDTASLLLARVAPGLAVERLAELLPEAEPGDVIAALRAHDALAGDVLLVAHQPLLGRLAAQLAGGVEPRFPPATLIGIEFEGHPRAGTGRVVATRRPGPA